MIFSLSLPAPSRTRSVPLSWGRTWPGNPWTGAQQRRMPPSSVIRHPSFVRPSLLPGRVLVIASLLLQGLCRARLIYCHHIHTHAFTLRSPIPSPCCRLCVAFMRLEAAALWVRAKNSIPTAARATIVIGRCSSTQHAREKSWI